MSSWTYSNQHIENITVPKLLLLKVQNDILMQLDISNTVILILLDLSAAFDTIDHNKLLKRMEEHCGIKGTALKFIKSYLIDRKQKVVIGENESSEEDVKYGLPQGSVLGPIIFQIYVSSWRSNKGTWPAISHLC